MSSRDATGKRNAPTGPRHLLLSDPFTRRTASRSTRDEREPTSDTASPSISQPQLQSRRPTNPFDDARVVSSSPRELSESSRTSSPQPWTDKQTVTSPDGSSEGEINKSYFAGQQSVRSGFSSRSGSSSLRSSRRKPSSLAASLLSRPKTPDSANKPSHPAARWDQLRRHVLQPVRPASPASFQSPQATPTLSSASSTFTSLPPRAPTPKPSRLARLGFRQVVEQAREVALDHARRFALDIQRACWAARGGDTSRPRFEREMSTGSGVPTFNLPFMSNTSLPLSSHPTGIGFPTGKKHELRRPPSIQSFAGANRSGHSVQYLRGVVLQGINDGLTSHPLPLEGLILSTLLGPFLTQGGETKMDEERVMAIELFDVIARTWSPVDEYSVAARCLWCATVAIHVPPPVRYQVITNLGHVIASAWKGRPVVRPHSIVAVGQELYALLASINVSAQTNNLAEETALVKRIIADLSGSNIPAKFSSETYIAAKLIKEEIQLVSEELMQEARARGIEYNPSLNQRWLVMGMLEEPFPPSAIGSTGLMAALNSRRLTSLADGALMLLSVALDEPRKLANAKLVAHFIQSQVLTDIENLSGPGATRAKEMLSQVALKVICMETTRELTQWAASLISKWYTESSLKSMLDSFQSMLLRIIEHGDWANIVLTFTSAMLWLPHDVCEKLLLATLPTFNDRLADDSPPTPNIPLSSCLDRISAVFPRIFYKPLFSCAASSKEHIVVNHLRALLAIAKFLPDLWTRDAEMIAVALMSDAGPGKGSTVPAEEVTWGTARLGQSVLMFEVIGSIQSARRHKEGSSHSDQGLIDAVKFALSLEARLFVGLESKEKMKLIPPSQRLLFCILFRELRLLTRSLKAAPWLPRIVNWFMAYEEASRDYDIELAESLKNLEELYTMASQSPRANNRRSTMLFSPTVDAVMEPDAVTALTAKRPLLTSLTKGFLPKVLKLFVAVSALLSAEDYRRIGPLVWAQHMTGAGTSSIASACFLIMQFAEKAPPELLTTVEVDLRSSSALTKLDAINKISIIVNWRFQILSQHIIADRAHRPFKVARGPLPFVATDMGSSVFVPPEELEDLKDNLPLELRKQLAEIGWTSEDEVVDSRYQRIKTPLSILPAYQLDHMDNQHDLPSSASSPTLGSPGSPKKEFIDKVDDGGLLRRNSSTGGPMYGMKRRSIFVPSLSSVLPRLATLVFDEDFNVACAARHILLDLMRNDPALLTRPMLDFLAHEQKDVGQAATTMTAFLHVVSTLPPPMAHGLLNNLSGFIKYAIRVIVETPESLRDYAYAMPFISKLALQVQDMKFRDIRRAKIELFLIPSGAFWFPPTAPAAPIFPRSLSDIQKLYGPNSSPRGGLVYLTMVRISQNMFFTDILKQNPSDVQNIRKNMAQFVLPSLEPHSEPLSLELKDFAPRTAGFCSNIRDDALKMLSLMLARSHLLLVAQIFRSLSRHLNDRHELALLVDGINRILLAHGDDINIVAHGIIAFLVATTRFKRLFTTAGGYTFIMPILMKLYSEANDYPGVRSAVEYAVNRFHALHQDGFLYQSLEVITHMMKLRKVDQAWLSRRVFLLFSSLQKTTASNADIAGIHHANKRQEREALLLKSAEEQPQKLLPFLRSEPTGSRDRPTMGLQEEYETKPLNFGNFVRLILTVIAHDPTILRAELFLHLYRYLVPSLYHASTSSRSYLRDSIPALMELLMRLSSKAKTGDTTASENEEVEDIVSGTSMQNQMFEKSKTPNDPIAMRLDFLTLVAAYVRAGGDLESSSLSRVFELVRSMLKDCSHETSTSLSAFISDFTKCVLLRDHPPPVKLVTLFLTHLVPLVASFSSALDFSVVFDSIAQLTLNHVYSHSRPFADVVMQICTSALDFVQSEKLYMVTPFRKSLVSLLSHTIYLRDGDLLEIIHKRDPCYEFLSGIILPLVMILPTRSQLASSGIRLDATRLDLHPRTWFGFVYYAFFAGVGAESAPSSLLERAKSQVHIRRRRTPPMSERIAIIVTCVQIIKVILIRAEDDIKSYLPDIWSFLAAFLRPLLTDANARFAVEQPIHSNFTTPTHTPRNSGQFAGGSSSFSISAGLQSPSFQPEKGLQSPRVVDYLFWSLAELLCSYRTPLLLQMRMFLRERVIALDDELQGARPYLHMPQSPSSRRNSSTVFTKPRRSIYDSPSPAGSPKLATSFSYLNPRDVMFAAQDGRSPPAAFLTSSGSAPPGVATTSRGQEVTISAPMPSSIKRARSPGRGVSAARQVAKSAKVKGPGLVQDTYRRIRVVQTYFGYDSHLLPIPGESHLSGQPAHAGVVRSWTKREALIALEDEMKKLNEELEEMLRTAEEDIVIVTEHEEPASPLLASPLGSG
ncbi:hypothetical protein HGRIS_011312 [Hohenbuehelia grisea]|uniref:Protein UNC80 C-terminal domain-containing protein n=1 Tax=Hohenbuehelia grisea TaxID=104357 RepID=A0ABR3JWM3_9AGAR